MNSNNNLELDGVVFPRWIVGEDAYAEEDDDYFIVYQDSPRFVARWDFAADDGDFDGEVFEFEGEQAGDDSLFIYGLVWIDAPPEDTDAERLMEEAAEAIEFWLANNSDVVDESD